MSELPKDPFSSMDSSSVTTHHIFRSYVDAGFTEDQALYLVGCLLSVGAMMTGRGGA